LPRREIGRNGLDERRRVARLQAFQQAGWRLLPAVQTQFIGAVGKQALRQMPAQEAPGAGQQDLHRAALAPATMASITLQTRSTWAGGIGSGAAPAMES